MPAAAVIPVLIIYINIVAVKKLVVAIMIIINDFILCKIYFIIIRII